MSYEIIRLGTAEELISRYQANDLLESSQLLKTFDVVPKTHAMPLLLCAVRQNKAAGLIFAECNKTLQLTELKQLYVLYEHRSNHVGRSLVEKLVEEAKKEGCYFISLIYLQDDPHTPALERLLKANQWTTSIPFSVHCLFNAFSFNPPWIKTNTHFTKEFEEFPWINLSEAEKNELMLRVENGTIPAFVSPFRNESQIEYQNSLGLRHQGKVVGWSITHRLTPDTITYSALYIEPYLQFCGAGILLLIDSMLLHKKLPVQWAKFELPLLHVNSAWMRFIKRRLIPYADKVSIFLQATFFAR